MEQIVTIISTLGFPIACVIGMGYFIFMAFKMFFAKSEKREDKLYDIISECQAVNNDLLKTNANFVSVLEKHNEDLEVIKNDITDIKTTLEINRRSSDK